MGTMMRSPKPRTRPATSSVRGQGRLGSPVRRQGCRSSCTRLLRGLTNEVQRRAKRVRCNAGLGCWCPQAARSLRSPGPPRCPEPQAPRDPDDRASADEREGADVGPTNLGRVPLRVAALVDGAPWLRNRGTARRWCWWLRARPPRQARKCDAATTRSECESGTPSRLRDLQRPRTLCPSSRNATMR